ncbi:hypothetical protein CVS40_9798 [Lucilia cuprina]|nr:hypothetical protein CVS40_9798 [Lucilia cuprina]
MKRVPGYRCYQWFLGSRRKGYDSCGMAYKKFNRTETHTIECNRMNRNMLASVCIRWCNRVPRGDGRWRQVINVVPVADTGVTGVCNWESNENGVYWEEC